MFAKVGALSPLFALLVVVAGTALAHEPNELSNCDVAAEEEPTDYEVVLPEDLAVVYVLTPPDEVPQVWIESNGYAGLQTHAHPCRTSPDHTPTTVDGDTRIV